MAFNIAGFNNILDNVFINISIHLVKSMLFVQSKTETRIAIC
jgi:hypothetical protein